MLSNPNQRNKTYVMLAALVIIFVFYQVCLLISRVGEAKVSVVVIPKDSVVTLDNKPISGRTLYLGPGDYTFAASKDGWSTDSQPLHVEKKAVEIGLIPDPNSDKAQRFLKDNPDIQLQREAIGGLRANLKGQQTKDQNPFISVLPYSSLGGLFTIDYGPSKSRKDGVFYIVSGSSPNGRLNAIQWIKDHGQDPTDLEITYADFINPLQQNEDAR